MGARTSQKADSAEVLADLAKAYEGGGGVNRQKLLEQAVNHGCLLEVLASYQWDRRLVCGGLTSKKISPITGILAGAMAATFDVMFYTTRSRKSRTKHQGSGLPGTWTLYVPQ